MAKKHYIILDTETCADARVPYDVAFTVIDRAGNIVERHQFFVEEAFSPAWLYAIEKDRFAQHKAAFYRAAASEQVECIAPYWEVVDVLRTTAQEYNAVICAYNARFDVGVMRDFAAALGVEDPFDGIQVWDIWNIALNSFCSCRKYARWATETGNVTDKGNAKSSAEAVYRYLTGNNSFIEDHTALSDTAIEAYILARAFKRKRKLVTEMCVPMFEHPVWLAYLKA